MRGSLASECNVQRYTVWNNVRVYHLTIKTNLHVLLQCRVADLQMQQLRVASSEAAADTDECITGELWSGSVLSGLLAVTRKETMQ